MNIAVSDIGEDISFTSTELAAISEEFGNYLFDYSFFQNETASKYFGWNIQGTNEEYCDLGRLQLWGLKDNAGPSVIGLGKHISQLHREIFVLYVVSYIHYKSWQSIFLP